LGLTSVKFFKKETLPHKPKTQGKSKVGPNYTKHVTTTLFDHILEPNCGQQLWLSHVWCICGLLSTFYLYFGLYGKLFFMILDSVSDLLSVA